VVDVVDVVGSEVDVVDVVDVVGSEVDVVVEVELVVVELVDVEPVVVDVDVVDSDALAVVSAEGDPLDTVEVDVVSGVTRTVTFVLTFPD